MRSNFDDKEFTRNKGTKKNSFQDVKDKRKTTDKNPSQKRAGKFEKQEKNRSEKFLEIIKTVRKIQNLRFKYEDEKINCNGDMSPAMINKYINLQKQQIEMIVEISEKLKISNRGQHKALKVARTISDIAGSTEITDESILEAFSYRTREW